MSEIATSAKMMTINPALRRSIKLKKGTMGTKDYVAPAPAPVPVPKIKSLPPDMRASMMDKLAGMETHQYNAGMGHPIDYISRRLTTYRGQDRYWGKNFAKADEFLKAVQIFIKSKAISATWRGEQQDIILVSDWELIFMDEPDYVAPVAESDSEDLMDTDVKYIQTKEAKKEVSETDKDKKALKVIIAWLRGNQKRSDKYKSSGSGKRYSIPYWDTGGNKMLEAGIQLDGKSFTDPSDKEAFFTVSRDTGRIEMLGPKENTFLHWADILKSKS